MRSILMIGCWIFFYQFCSAQLSTKDIINQSIQYHDPEGLLNKGSVTLHLKETRPQGSDRTSTVVMDQGKEYYHISRKVDDATTEMTFDKGSAKFKLNGSDNVSTEDLAKHRLTSERLQSMKNYYRYLWLAPITLLDPGTIVDETFDTVDFFGKNCIQIRITYDPEVGEDIWYFYFNPKSYALEGYRFYHNETANDGEYILLSETTTYKSVKIPKSRKWYMHKNDKYLGADSLTRLEIE